MNTKKLYRPSRTEDEKIEQRVVKTSEVPTSRYLTLKLYSVVRSKTIIQTLFDHGIGMSYNKVLDLISEIAVEMKDLFRRSGNNLLPSQLVIGVFTAMIDDNLDANSGSISSTS